MLKLRSLTAQCESNVPRLGSETWLSSAHRLQLGGEEFGLEESEGRTRQFWKDLAQRTDDSFSFSEHVLRKRYQFLLELREADPDAMQQAAVPSSLAGRTHRAKTAWEAPPLPPDKLSPLSVRFMLDDVPTRMAGLGPRIPSCAKGISSMTRGTCTSSRPSC